MTKFPGGRRQAAVFFCLPVLAIGLLVIPVPAAAASPELDRDCALRMAESADPSMTLAELRQQCAIPAGESAEAVSTAKQAEPPREPKIAGLVEKRLTADREAARRPFSIMAHKPNYFLAAAYNREGWSSEPSSDASGGQIIEFDDVEGQFQVSLKVPLAIGLFGDRMDGGETGDGGDGADDHEGGDQPQEDEDRIGQAVAGAFDGGNESLARLGRLGGDVCHGGIPDAVNTASLGRYVLIKSGGNAASRRVLWS